jgi:formylglycine-generating enzyme required for sulfatase activity
MAGIFINYRRDDAPGVAGRLFDYLALKYPRNTLFMDVDAMKPGMDFAEQLDAQVSQCRVLLAVIGPRWFEIKDQAGHRRLDNEKDYVRIELASALKRGIPVIPILTDGGMMPPEEDLADDLKPLVRRHALELRHTRFNADADAIAHALEDVVPQRRWPRRPVAAGAVVAATVVALAIFWPKLSAELHRAAPLQTAQHVPPPAPESVAQPPLAQSTQQQPSAQTASPPTVQTPLAPAQATQQPAARFAVKSALPPFVTLTAAREHALLPGDSFRECATCPEMVVAPAGSFVMGSPASEYGRGGNEGPQHTVIFAQAFAVGRFAVTFDEWDACVADGGCGRYSPPDQGWGRGRRPVTSVSLSDAKGYLAWLSHKTGAIYRLPSEAEREYVARAGTTTPYWWGLTISPDQANYGGSVKQSVPVDSFLPNPWGLYQVHGNVSEWTNDCLHDNYVGAPTDGSAWTEPECDVPIRRGGSMGSPPIALRSAARGFRAHPEDREPYLGFRVVRVLGTDLR